MAAGWVNAFLVDLPAVDEALAGATAPQRPRRGLGSGRQTALLGKPRWLVDFAEQWDERTMSQATDDDPAPLLAVDLMPNLIAAAAHREDLRAWPEAERALALALLRAATTELGEPLTVDAWSTCERAGVAAMTDALFQAQAVVRLPAYGVRGAGRWPCTPHAGVEQYTPDDAVRCLAMTGGLRLAEPEHQARLEELRSWWRESARARRMMLTFWGEDVPDPA